MMATPRIEEISAETFGAVVREITAFDSIVEQLETAYGVPFSGARGLHAQAALAARFGDDPRSLLQECWRIIANKIFQSPNGGLQHCNSLLELARQRDPAAAEFIATLENR